MRGIRESVLAVSLFAGLAGCLLADDPVAPVVPSEYPPPPATKLEAFQSPTGALFSIAHEDLGRVQGVLIQLVEMRDQEGKPIRGLVLYISDSMGTKRSYVDADEIPALLQACDKLLDATSNPTSLKTYEARYLTRGGLQVTAMITDRQATAYLVRVGRFDATAETNFGMVSMQQLRSILATAVDRLSALSE